MGRLEGMGRRRGLSQSGRECRGVTAEEEKGAWMMMDDHTCRISKK